MVENTAAPDLHERSLEWVADTVRAWKIQNRAARAKQATLAPKVRQYILSNASGWEDLVGPLSMLHPDLLDEADLWFDLAIEALEELRVPFSLSHPVARIEQQFGVETKRAEDAERDGADVAGGRDELEARMAAFDERLAQIERLVPLVLQLDASVRAAAAALSSVEQSEGTARRSPGAPSSPER